MRLNKAIPGYLFTSSEFERNLIRDRTNAGLAAARARGRTGGRPKKLDEQQRTRNIKDGEDFQEYPVQLCAK